MTTRKKELIFNELSLGSSVDEISKKFNTNKSYIYKVKSELKSKDKLSNKLIDVTHLVKEPKLNVININGYTLKCNDEILTKLIKSIANDWFN